MKTTGNGQRRLLFSTLALLSVAWLAAPLAGQDGANDGFIFFTTDRDNPSNAGMCNNCEDIYVMSPDGTNPTRLTHGGGAGSRYGCLQQRWCRLVPQQEAGRVSEQPGESCSADLPDECRWQ